MKGFIEYEGVKYYDYDVYITPRNTSYYGQCNFAVDCALYGRLHENMKSMLQDIKVPKGSEIFVAPKCPIASEDIRHSYTVKRKLDTGDYNIFSDIPNWTAYIYSNIALILPTRNAIIMYEKYWDEAVSKTEHELIESFFPDFNYDKEQFINVVSPYGPGRTNDYFFLNVHPSWIDFLAGRLTKPCVHYSNLDINNEQEITQDLIDLVYATGVSSRINRKSIDDFKIQLHALNQHNWRERPRTVSILLHNLLSPKETRTVRNYVNHHSTEQDKPIKMLMNTYADKFANKEDFELCRKMVAKIFNMQEGTMFVDIEDMTDKCKKLGLPMRIFKELFNVCVRIKDKEWENEQD